MEISSISKSALRIKGKNAVLAVDPSDKSEYNAALLLGNATSLNTTGAEIAISGPGEYETGGIKITGIRSEDSMVYSLTVESVSVLVGKLNTLEKLHTKLKEANILVINCENAADASFLTSLVTNIIIFYGEKAAEVSKSLGHENVKILSKYATTIDKLPAEVEAVILE